jgi:hypothetical protein
MLSPEVIKQIAKKAKEAGNSAQPDMKKLRRAASKASARKLMAALKNDNDEAFLEAFSELRETYGHNFGESEDED